MSVIKEVYAREVLSASGVPTLEVDLLMDNFIARAAVPSVKAQEHAVVLRDKKSRFNGMGVTRAVGYLQYYASRHIKGMDARQQCDIDEMLLSLDGTKNRQSIGANGLLALSMAACRAGAYSKNLPLYRHIAEMYGTAHLKMPSLIIPLLSTRLMMRDFMIISKGSLHKQLEAAHAVHKELGKIVRMRYRDDGVIKKGIYHVPILQSHDAIELLLHAARQAGYGIKIGMRCVPSHEQNNYMLSGKTLTAAQLVDYYKMLVKNYPLTHIEDALSHEHKSELRRITSRVHVSLGQLGLSHAWNVRKFAREKAANNLTLRLHQQATVTELMETARAAHKNKWSICAATSPHETADDFLADFAVGIGAEHLKVGLFHAENAAKINQLLRIEEMM